MIVRVLFCLVCWLALAAGCAPTHSELRAPVDRELSRRMGAPTSLDASIAPLLAQPITRDGAVAIALANNARLRATLEDIGIASGELSGAIGLGPLNVDGAVRFKGGDVSEFEVDVIQNIVGLISAPRRRAAARGDLAAARAIATATALRLVAQVEIAHNDLIAAQQELELRTTAFDAADAAATVRERMHAAGNTSDLAQARDRDAREQARLDLARAQAAIEIRRETLNALLGLSGEQTKWTVAGTLAELPAAAPALDDLETAAVTASLELEAGRARVDGAANRVGAETVRTWLPEIGIGISVGDLGEGNEVGPAFRIGIPLLDHRAAERARARGAYAKAELELTATAVELRANARAARVAALAAYQEARHLRDVVLPLRQQIVDQTLLHYNAMDATPFELLVARRQLADAGQQYLDAVRRYWNATAEVTALRRGVQVKVSPIAAPSTITAPATDSH